MTVKKLQNILLIFLLALYAILVTSKINLVTADLGRHLKNGEMILSGKFSVLTTNFYSYTFPEFSFLNHHWGSGVLFYVIQKLFGFAGLSIFFTLISLTTFFIFFLIAQKKSSFNVAILVSIIALPLLVSRTEIRPEAFSYLLSGIFLWILIFKRKRLWLLPILEIIWVNLHIYFFLGLFLIGVFCISELFIFLVKKSKKSLEELKNLILFGGISILAAIVNPAFIKGALYPLQIFKGYGYRLFENQSVLFLDKIVRYPQNLYFKIAFGVLILSWVYVLIKRQNISITNLIFSLFFSYLGWTAVRNFNLFGLFLIPIVAGNLKGVLESGGVEEDGVYPESSSRGEIKMVWQFFVTTFLMVVLILGIFLLNPFYWQGKISFGVRLKEGNENAANFFKKNNLIGPIFNNYDNGGYLIYFLFPKEKVFVDNRPEAYPQDFFDKTYIPMQENDATWQIEDKKYNFNIIFFHRNDLTPWGQTFLVSRIKDPVWAPVYVDESQIIFLKRNKENEEVIKKFELSKEMFSVK